MEPPLPLYIFIRVQSGGGHQKRGVGKKWPIFWAESAENGKNGLKGHIFGAADDKNFENFQWFCANSLTFVKNEAFIAWKCIVMQKMTKKVEIIALYGPIFEVSKVTNFSQIPLLRWHNPKWPPQFEPWYSYLTHFHSGKRNAKIRA